MSERFGPNFAPGSFALQQSIRLVYTLQALSRGQNRATRATRDNQDAHTHRNSTHTHSATENKHNSQPETTKGSWPLLLPRRRHRRRLCCFCCAAVAAAVVTYGHLFSVFLKKYDAVLRNANRFFLFSIRDLYFCHLMEFRRFAHRKHSQGDAGMNVAFFKLDRIIG